MIKKQHILLAALMLVATITCHAQIKLSPMVRSIMLEAQNTTNAKGKQQPERRLNAFVRTTDTNVLRQNDCHILASFGDIHIANIPVSRLRSLISNDAIKRIEVGKSCMTLNDEAAKAVNMAQVHQAEVPGIQPVDGLTLTGRGVVVGVMDVGFDLTHPTFYSRDMSRYRIKALWDQLDFTQGGSPVTNADTTNVGRQYIGQEQLLQKQHSTDAETEHHGTHTLGTAAGSGGEGNPEVPIRYSGMAPDADICLVANAIGNNLPLVPEDQRYLYNNTLDVLGFKYIFDYATAHNQPCVISFSEGAYPNMDGDDVLYCEALNSMFGPGRILCASAGNENTKLTYLLKPVGKSEEGVFVGEKKHSMYFTARSSDKMTLRISFMNDATNGIVREYHTDQCLLLSDDDDVFTDTLMVNGLEHVVYLAAYPSCYNEKEWATEIAIQTNDSTYISRDSKLKLTLLGENVRSELFSMSSGFIVDPFTGDNPAEGSHNIHTPGGLPGVICVGSINTRQEVTLADGTVRPMNRGGIGEISDFSSTGPSMCGEIKPDVCAPGASVYSAASSWAAGGIQNVWGVVSTFDYNGRKYGWRTDQGTSMATPVVAGIVATWLQACPTLTPQQVLEAIASTCTQSLDFEFYDCITDDRGILKNNTYGYGNIDAYAGLQYVLNNFTGIRDITADTAGNSTAVYDLMGRRVETMRPGNIYIRNGKKTILR